MTSADWNREEFLAWVKSRALEYLELGEPGKALASLSSDLRKHPETEGHPDIVRGHLLMAKGELDTEQKMRDFIEQLS